MTNASTATKNLEHVQIGSQPFLLFPLTATETRWSDVGETTIFDRKLLLDTNGLLPLLPIRFYVGATHMTKDNAISPYTDKKSQSEKNKDHNIPYTNAPLCLDASIHAKALQSLHLTEKKEAPPFYLLPEAKKTLSRLRFHLLIPTKDTLGSNRPILTAFISKPDKTALSIGELRFWQFTPEKAIIKKAYFFMLPSDAAIMQAIQGQFTLH